MKKVIFLLCLLAVSLGTFANSVNEEVLKMFSKTYPDAKSITWSEQKEGYMVYFSKKDVSYRIVYDASGNVVYSIKYYEEDNLSPLLLNKVKKAYADYRIRCVVERTSEEGTDFYITIETDKKLITLKSDMAGNFEVESKLDKAE
ncbi:MAG: hypothetical protein V4450_10505 [Bacteroidota bacterium]